MIFPFIVYVNFSLDDMTLNICSIVSLLTKSPMKPTFFDGLSVDVYFYVEGPFQYFSDLFETFSVEYKFVINPSNTILRASGVMANAGFFCLCIEVGDIFRY